MANTPRSMRRTVLLASAVALLGAVSACGSDNGTANTASSVTTAASSRQPDATEPSTAGSSSAPESTAGSAPATGSVPTDTAGSGAASARSDARCHTSELRASVGRMDPGAGQRNFPVVLTNTSKRTCTLYGYPGAAFTDKSGKQLGPDPKRAPGSPNVVTLAPGKGAWSGLSFSSPDISGARTATPAVLVVTPPDERDPLKVTWTAGKVPVGGNSSTVRLGALEPGTSP
ncbi:DUF4232 domain-containing protein [Streptomyces sp. NPDC003717]|uniref:DUF4232 domain-containing protein n=1 Tax=Streptomyces sp. NPDC003717 TaxID=3154276 RepID=UPI0033B186AD